jgi:hypothetical protein
VRSACGGCNAFRLTFSPQGFGDMDHAGTNEQEAAEWTPAIPEMVAPDEQIPDYLG